MRAGRSRKSEGEGETKCAEDASGGTLVRAQQGRLRGVGLARNIVSQVTICRCVMVKIEFRTLI